MADRVIVSLNNCVYHPLKLNHIVKPAVVLIGRDTATKKRVYFQSTVKPFFYVEDWVLNGLSKQSLYNLGVVKNEYSSARTLRNRLTRKLIVKHPLAVDDVVRYLKKMHRANTYEADLAKISGLPIRFLTQHNIRSGFEVLNHEVIPREVEPCLRYWAFDLEWLSSKKSSVNPKKDEPIAMFSWYDSFEDKIFTVHWHEKGFKPCSGKHVVYQVEDEKALLAFLFEKLDEQNPDLLTAHNLYRADMTKWLARILKHRLDLNKLSPKPFRSVDMRRRITIKGRILFDMLAAFKFYTNKELRSYSLEFIAENEKLGYPKIRFKHPTLKYWEDSAPICFDMLDSNIKAYLKHIGVKNDFRPSYIIYLRNYFDVKILLAYEKKHNLIEFFNSLRSFAGCLFEDIFLKHKIFDAVLLRMCSGKTALPTGKASRGASGGFRGALVLEPEQGFYENVVCIDFKRQYPSIIRAMNISPETFAGEAYRDIEKFVESHLAKGHCVAYDKHFAYAFKRKPKGLMVKVVNHFWKQRDIYEAKAKRAAEEGKKEEEKIAKFKAFQSKQILNATFGVMSFSGFRLHSVPCSAAIAFMARQGSLRVIEMLEESGYKVIYGDTDSVFFISTQNIEELNKLLNDLSKKLNAEMRAKWNALQDPFTIDLKRIYSTFYIPSKKRYAGLYVWDEKRGFTKGFEWKGLESIRSDSSRLEQETQREILRMLLEKADKEEIAEFWFETLKKLSKKEFELWQTGYPEKLGKPFEMVNGKITEYGYGNKAPAHIKAVYYSNKYLGTDFSSGDKPVRIPIRPGMLTTYPRKFSMHFKNGQERVYEAKWIAIDESLVLSKEIEEAVDWQFIRKRLEKKIKDVLTKCKVELNPQGLDRWL